MKKELQKIANTLVLYSYHVNGNGLFMGRMGIILFLFRYSRFANNTYYSDFAGDLLDKVLSASGTVEYDFENGLTGIGWGVNYLLRNNLVEGDVNSVLHNVDKKVFSRIFCNPEKSIFGHAIYLLERLKINRDVDYFEKQIENILSICSKGLLEYKGKITLYHINSVLYFLIEIDKMQKYTDKISEIRNSLPTVLKMIEEQELADSSSLQIFDFILSKVDVEQKINWNRILECRPQKTFDIICPIEQYIRNACLQDLYYGQVDIETPSFDEIRKFIDDKQNDITINGFLYAKGLAGLGCALLSQVE